MQMKVSNLGGAFFEFTQMTKVSNIETRDMQPYIETGNMQQGALYSPGGCDTNTIIKGNSTQLTLC